MNPTQPSRPSLSRRILRWTGRIGLGFVALLAVLILTAYVVSGRRMAQHFAVPESVLLDAPFASDSALVAAGERLATIRGCNDCHGLDFGGKVLIDDPMLGRVVTANVSPGSAVDSFSMADWDRAVRHGVSPSGRGYLIMPSHEFHVLSDEDLAAIVAYIRQVPPVRHALPAMQVRPLGHALHVAGVLDLVPASLIDHAAPHTAAPPVGPTPEYGHYVASGCIGCHGADYAGGPIPGLGVVAANLTPDPETGIGSWTQEDLARVLKTGVRPDGRPLNPVMSVEASKLLTDTEVAAIWAYLRTLPPVRKEGT